MQNGAFSNLIGMPSVDIRVAADPEGRKVAQLVSGRISLTEKQVKAEKILFLSSSGQSSLEPEFIIILRACATLVLPERRTPGPSSPCLAKWQRVHNFIGFSKFMCDVDSEAQSEEKKEKRKKRREK